MDDHRVGRLMMKGGLPWTHKSVTNWGTLHHVSFLWYAHLILYMYIILLTPLPLPELVHDEDLTVGFIRLNNLPAMFAVEINNGQEYILCFNGKSTTQSIPPPPPSNIICFL